MSVNLMIMSNSLGACVLKAPLHTTRFAPRNPEMIRAPFCFSIQLQSMLVCVSILAVGSSTSAQTLQEQLRQEGMVAQCQDAVYSRRQVVF